MTDSTHAHAKGDIPEQAHRDRDVTEASRDASEQATSVGTPRSLDSLTVPDSLALVGTKRWSTTDYGWMEPAEQAKCAESAIAPLVARARGLVSVRPGEVRATNARLSMSTAQGRQLRAAVGASSAMLMPWFTGSDAHRYWQAAAGSLDPDTDIHIASPQMRPAPENVQVNPRNGKPVKYVNLKDSSAVIGVHPSIPADWYAPDVQTAFFTEGMLKADSALTALLLEAGVDENALRVADGETLLAARTRLRDMLAGLPRDRWVSLFAFLSVTTWKNRHDWVSISLKDKTVMVAFDGDTSSNLQVWKQANDLFDYLRSHHATPVLMDLSAVSDGPSKMGVDDYLAGGGSWAAFTQMAKPSLPPRPATSGDAEAGRWVSRIERGVTEEWVPSPESGSGHWKTVLPYSVRLAAVEQDRQVSPTEEATGRLDPTPDAGADSFAVLEFTFHDPVTGELRTAAVDGPAKLVLSDPAGWARTDAVVVPPEVLTRPQFPPKEWRNMMDAAKTVDPEKTISRALWRHMGWVPTEDGTSVFVLGKQVVDSDGDASVQAATSIQRQMPDAVKYGVSIPADDDEARDALRRVVELYRPQDPAQRPWHRPHYAAAVLATALRPAAPLRSRVAVYLSGHTGRGKALPLTAPIPVPVSERHRTGWAVLGQMAVGDQLYAPDGTVTTVRALSPVWNDEKVFELLLSDGQTFTASGNHIMAVSTTASRATHAAAPPVPAATAWEARQLAEYAASLSSGDATTFASLADALGTDTVTLQQVADAAGLPSEEISGDTVYPAAELLVAFGDSLLAGGPENLLLTSVTVADLAARHADGEPGFAIRTTASVAGAGAKVSAGLVKAAAGAVAESDGPIPPSWLRASRGERQALFTALVTRYGRRSAGGGTMSLPNEVLADQTTELARSLGCVVRQDGTSLAYTDPFEGQWLHVVGVRHVATVPTRCLQVEHHTGQFLAYGFVANHNSWTAARIMDFWSSQPGTWSNVSLPGGAGDTAAAMELAVSRTPLWVVDDLPPGPDFKEAQARIDATIRAVHNGAAKGRATRTMTTAVKNPPRALLVVSAEVPPVNSDSIMNRIVHMRVGTRLLAEDTKVTDAVVAASETDCPQAVVTGYILRMMARRIATDGWGRTAAELRGKADEAAVNARKRIAKITGSDKVAKRQSDSIADLSLGIVMLEMMIAELGLDTSDRYLASLPTMLRQDLYLVAAEGFAEQSENSVAHRFVRAAADLLRQGVGHAVAAGSDALPILTDETPCGTESIQLNTALGWTRSGHDGFWAPRGNRIADVGYHRNGYPYLVVSTSTVQAVAARYAEFGSYSANAIFDALHEAGLAGPWKQVSPKDPRQRVGGIRGIAIAMSVVVEDETLAPPQVDSVDDAESGAS